MGDQKNYRGKGVRVSGSNELGRIGSHLRDLGRFYFSLLSSMIGHQFGHVIKIRDNSCLRIFVVHTEY
jgi:hypothetical protein